MTTPITKKDEFVEVSTSVLREYMPGFGESNFALLENVRRDLVGVAELLVRMRPALDAPEMPLETIASELVDRSIERIDICHNEIDCEREESQGVTPKNVSRRS